MRKVVIMLSLVAGIFCFNTNAQAVVINWTDWTDFNTLNSFTAFGTMTTETSVVDVTYYHPIDVGFIQLSGGTDYWQNNRSGRNPDTSPYTSGVVDNIPTGTDIIALDTVGLQTLTFSETIANPVFAYVSLNGNGYKFDQDFEILSFGDASDGNDCGYWGCGTSYKEVVEVSPGVFEYRLLGTGEPHGALRFTGSFDQVSWTSLTNEYWNGFTVGIEGTEEEVFPDTNAVPEPATMALFGTGLAGAFIRRRFVG